MTRRDVLIALALGTVVSRAWAEGDGRLHLRQGSGGQVGQPALPTERALPATQVDQDRWAKEIAAFAAEDAARGVGALCSASGEQEQCEGKRW